MSAQNYSDLAVHFGHSITVALYGEGDNIAIECEECSEVLLDFDNEDEDFSDDFPLSLEYDEG
jgi:hypothetical protein